MRHTLIAVLIVLLTALSLSADTEVGQVNRTGFRRFSFTPRGDSQVNVTLSWLSRTAQLVMTIVCGDADPLVFGSTVGALDRFALINAGVVSDVPCEIGITAARGSSRFWLNVLLQTDQPVRATGGVPRSFMTTIEERSHLTLAVEQQLTRLSRIAQ